MLLGVDRKNISLHTNHMFAIMMPDISEIQVLSLFLKLLKKKGGGIMQKNEKCLHRIIHQLLLVIFILLTIIILK